MWLALDHGRADAREAALPYLAARLPDPLPPRLLDFSSDPGSRIRRALVRILATRRCAEHQGVLRKLIDDDWSDAEAFHYEEPSYPIAREAVVGLAAYGCLSDDIGEVLLFRAERTDDRSLGMVALDTAAQCCSPAIRKKIWALSFIDQARWVRVDAIDALSSGRCRRKRDPRRHHRQAPPAISTALGRFRLRFARESWSGRGRARGDGANCIFDQAARAVAARRLGPRRPRPPSRARAAGVARIRSPRAATARSRR